MKCQLAVFIFVFALTGCLPGGKTGGQERPEGKDGARSQAPAKNAPGQIGSGRNGPNPSPNPLSSHSPEAFAPEVPAPDVAHDGKPSSLIPQSTDLNRSGEGGNSSFSYSVIGYRRGNSVPIPQCQATLTRKEVVAGVATCSVVTAAHCLTDAEDINNPTTPPSRFGPDITGVDKRETKLVSLSAPDFGHQHPGYTRHARYCASRFSR